MARSSSCRRWLAKERCRYRPPTGAWYGQTGLAQTVAKEVAPYRSGSTQAHPYAVNTPMGVGDASAIEVFESEVHPVLPVTDGLQTDSRTRRDPDAVLYLCSDSANPLPARKLPIDMGHFLSDSTTRRRRRPSLVGRGLAVSSDYTQRVAGSVACVVGPAGVSGECVRTRALPAPAGHRRSRRDCARAAMCGSSGASPKVRTGETQACTVEHPRSSSRVREANVSVKIFFSSVQR